MHLLIRDKSWLLINGILIFFLNSALYYKIFFYTLNIPQKGIDDTQPCWKTCGNKFDLDL